MIFNLFGEENKEKRSRVFVIVGFDRDEHATVTNQKKFHLSPPRHLDMQKYKGNTHARATKRPVKRVKSATINEETFLLFRFFVVVVVFNCLEHISSYR